MDELEADIAAERARREGAESRDRSLLARIAKEAQAQQELKIERDRALEDAATLKAQLDEFIAQSRDAQRRGDGRFQATIGCCVQSATAGGGKPEYRRSCFQPQSRQERSPNSSLPLRPLASRRSTAELDERSAQAKRGLGKQENRQLVCTQARVGLRPWRVALGVGAVCAALAALIVPLNWRWHLRWRARLRRHKFNLRRL